MGAPKPRTLEESERDRIAWNLADPIPSEPNNAALDECPSWPFDPVRSKDVEVELHRLPDRD